MKAIQMCILHGLSRFNSEQCNADYPKVCLNCWNVDVCVRVDRDSSASTSLPSSFALNIFSLFTSFIHSLHSAILCAFFVICNDFISYSNEATMMIMVAVGWIRVKWLRKFIWSQSEYNTNCSNENQTDVIAHSLWPICIAILVGLA